MEKCMICGEVVDILTNVHCKKHNLTKQDYRKKYGNNTYQKPFQYIKVRRSELDIYEIEKMVKRK